MSSEQSVAPKAPDKGRSPIFWVLAFVIATIVIYFGLNRPGTKLTPEGLPLISSPPEYETALSKARELSKGPIAKVDAGQELESADKRALLDAAKLYEGMALFRPNEIGPYAGAAISYHLAGENEQAQLWFGKAIKAAPALVTMEQRALLLEVYRLLSKSLFASQKYEEAAKAVDDGLYLKPNDPDLLAEKASALIQLQKLAEAKIIVDGILKDHPDHPRGSQLKMLLDSAMKPKTSPKS